MKHKVTRTRSLKYADQVDAVCTCGWATHMNKTNAMTGSLQVVRRELNYIIQDHLDEAKAAC
jgi:hypothetical protein